MTSMILLRSTAAIAKVDPEFGKVHFVEKVEVQKKKKKKKKLGLQSG